MAIMKRMLDYMDFDDALNAAGLPQQGSYRGYPPSQLITQFMLSVWCGANRFEHAEVTRFDPVLKRVFGFDRMANKFTQGVNESVMDSPYRWMFGQISINGVTLDLDSTVMTRYGTQQGAAKDYNPSKRGRASHHPLMAFVADTRMIANCSLRPGNAASANNVQGFLANTIHRLGTTKVALLRADSGFADSAFLDHLDSMKLHHIIALRHTRANPARTGECERLAALRDEHDRPVEGIELVRFQYQADSWSKVRWVIGIQQHIKVRLDSGGAKGKTLKLFADDPVIGQYRFSALTTDLNLSALEIWRMYRGRADCENRIKELKYDFAADSFNMKNFWGTEAAMNTVMLAFNLMSLMRQTLLKHSDVQHGKTPIQHTLQTLRYKLFAKPAFITTEGRKPILHLTIAMQQRAWMQGLWDAAKTLDLPAEFKPLYSP